MYEVLKNIMKISLPHKFPHKIVEFALLCLAHSLSFIVMAFLFAELEQSYKIKHLLDFYQYLLTIFWCAQLVTWNI